MAFGTNPVILRKYKTFITNSIMIGTNPVTIEKNGLFILDKTSHIHDEYNYIKTRAKMPW